MAIPIQERTRRFAESLGLRKREIPTFGVEDIREINGKHRLQIQLATTIFSLPLVHLNFPGVEEAAIGWFDPNPEKNPQIDEAATMAMETMLKTMNPKVAVMTNSTKSEHFIRAAVVKLPPGTRLVVLPSGSEETCKEDITNRSTGELTRYTPVTGTPKVMGYPRWAKGQVDYLNLEQLKVLCPNGKGLVIVDDVYTTGSTTKAMESVLGLGEGSKHQVAVIAIEKQFDGSTGKYRNKTLPKNIHAAFNLTEFLGLDGLGIDRSKLHFYDKPSIPPAIVSSGRR